MGRIVKIKYRLDTIGFSQAWRGPVTAKRLAQWVESYHNSLKTGGANAHLSEHYGYIPLLKEARIVNQETGNIVATWKAPMFMAF
jgi:hypothetical protein